MKILHLIAFSAAVLLAAPVMAEDSAPEANSGFGERLFGNVQLPGFGDPADDEAKALSEITPAAGDEGKDSEDANAADEDSEDEKDGTE